MIQNLKAQVQKLGTLALEVRDAVRDLQEPWGNMLGDPILVEEEEEEEEDKVVVVEAEPVMVGDHTALGVAYQRPLQALSTHRAD